MSITRFGSILAAISVNRVDEFRDLQLLETWGAWQVVTALVQALSSGRQTTPPTFNTYAKAYGLLDDEASSETKEDMKARLKKEQAVAFARAARTVALDKK